jgi:hypothetical protein
VIEEVLRWSSLLGIVKIVAKILQEEERVTFIPIVAEPEERIISQSIVV